MSRAEIKDRSWVEIDLSSFRHNLRQLKALLQPGQEFMQIVKADAYGHGAYEISRIAVDEGACYLGVANLEEGRLLRIQGCKAPILILSPSLSGEADEIVRYDLAATVSDQEFAAALNRAAAKVNGSVKVHLKVDSGMHRSGSESVNFPSLFEAVAALPHLHLEGALSHFASSESDPDFSREQLVQFETTIGHFRDRLRYSHIANSAGLINGLTGITNLVRLGILSFGIYTHPAQIASIDLFPVMTFRSQLAQIKKLTTGSGLGYNLSWRAERDTVYGIIPVGYADGYDFLLSNLGKAQIDGILCPVIGRVSMDMICVDLTDCTQVKIGNAVTLLGIGDTALRAENLASSYQGSAYELLCQVGRRARRYYLEDGKISHSAPLARRDFVSSDFSDSKLNQIIQSAISQRFQSNEIGELISREILRTFFFNRDKDIHYRKNFIHDIQLQESDLELHWRAVTQLSFSKVLQNNYFVVACATSDEALQSYFKRKDVEYRWLMDTSFDLSHDAFQLTDVFVNGLRLNTSIKMKNSCMEIRCQHPGLDGLVGEEVSFKINTRSYYPKSSHQLSVYITELTHGVRVSLEYPQTIKAIEVVPVFSGQNRYPDVLRKPGKISVFTKTGQWVFPLSGVIFAY